MNVFSLDWQFLAAATGGLDQFLDRVSQLVIPTLVHFKLYAWGELLRRLLMPVLVPASLSLLLSVALTRWKLWVLPWWMRSLFCSGLSLAVWLGFLVFLGLRFAHQQGAKLGVLSFLEQTWTPFAWISALAIVFPLVVFASLAASARRSFQE